MLYGEVMVAFFLKRPNVLFEASEELFLLNLAVNTQSYAA